MEYNGKVLVTLGTDARKPLITVRLLQMAATGERKTHQKFAHPLSDVYEKKCIAFLDIFQNKMLSAAKEMSACH